MAVKQMGIKELNVRVFDKLRQQARSLAVAEEVWWEEKKRFKVFLNEWALLTMRSIGESDDFKER